MNVYEIARVVAPSPDEPWTTELNSVTTYTHMLSEMNPCEMAAHFRNRGHDVAHTTRNAYNKMIPWNQQVLYVNWTEKGDMAYPDGWYIRIGQSINADLIGLEQQIRDDRRAVEALSLKTFEVSATRDVVESVCFTIDAPDEEAAIEVARELAADLEPAEWSLGDSTGIEIEVDSMNVTRVPDFTCKWCENEVLKSDATIVGEDYFHDSCLEELVEREKSE